MKILKYKYDCVVIGGGTAGVSCAWTLKDKMKVLVVEKELSLGGTQTNGMVTPMMPSYTKHLSFHYQLIQKLRANTNARLTDGINLKTIWFNPLELQNTIQEMLKSPSLDILYNCQVVEAFKNGNKIQKIKLICFNQIIEVEAKMFVDASGDAWLARLSDIKTTKANKNEHFSISYRFEIGNIDIMKLKKWCHLQDYKFYNCEDNSNFFEFVHILDSNKIGKVTEVFQKGFAKGELKALDLNYMQGFTIANKSGCMSFNNPQLPHKYTPTNISDLNKCVSIGQHSQIRLWKFLKNNVPGFENSHINSRANMLGIRESYRIVGKYVMTENDYLQRRKFVDGIARGDWYIDVHNDNCACERGNVKYQQGEYYEIPYRCLVTNEVSNYIAVGRHISTSLLMQASTRIQVTCQDLGQSAAIACIFSFENNIELNAIDGQELKSQLQKYVI